MPAMRQTKFYQHINLFVLKSSPEVTVGFTKRPWQAYYERTLLYGIKACIENALQLHKMTNALLQKQIRTQSDKSG